MINEIKMKTQQIQHGSLKPGSKGESNKVQIDESPNDSVKFQDAQTITAPIRFGSISGGLAVGAGYLGSGVLGAAALGAVASGIGVGGMLGSLGGMIGGIMGQALGGLMGEELKKDFAQNLEQVKAQRSRNADGRFRTKSGATQVDTLRETYGPNFAAGLPGNMPLLVLRASTGMSLTQLVKNPEKVEELRPVLSAWEAPKPAPGGRSRNADGTIRQKRGDTKIETLRKTYGLDFAAQLPGNWPLSLMRESTGMSLTEMVKNPEKLREALPKSRLEP